MGLRWWAVGLSCALVGSCSTADPAPAPPTVEESAAVGSTASPDAKPIRVAAAADSPAGILVGHAYAAALNGSGVPTRVVPQRDSAAGLAAVIDGKADLVGLSAAEAATVLGAVQIPPPTADAAQVDPPTAGEGRAAPTPSPSAAPLDATLAALRDVAETEDLRVLDPAEAAFGPAFVVRSGYAELNSVTTLSELAERSRQNPVVFAAPPGCRREPFCWAALTQTYGVEVSDSITAPWAEVPALVADKDAGVGWVRAADHEVADLGLQVLRDDQSVLPADNVVPVVRSDAAFSAVVDPVTRVQGLLSPDALRQMDAALDGGAAPRVAADAWVTITSAG